MATTYTRNLRLRLTSGLTPDALYNLQRIDESYGEQPYLSLSGDLMLRSPNDITIEPECSDLDGSGVLGSVNVGVSSHTLNAVNVYADTAKFNTANNKFRNTDLTTYTNITPTDTANSTLQLDMNGGVRKLDLSGGLTLSADFSAIGGNAVELTMPLPQTAALNLPTEGTLATLANPETFTNKTLISPVVNFPSMTGGTWEAGTLSNAILTHPTITAGHIDSTVIGESARAGGWFTTIVADAGSINSSPITTVDAVQDLNNKTLDACVIDGDHNTFRNVDYVTLNISNCIVDSDINTGADISYSKLNLADSIIDADISTIAQISGYKIVPHFAYQNVRTNNTLLFDDPVSGRYIGLTRPAAIVSSYTLQMPDADGLGGQTLITDGNGRLNWASIVTGSLFQNYVDIGNATDDRIQVDTSALGDILADTTTGMTIKSAVISDTHIADDAAIAWSKIAANPDITAATATKISYDAKGLVTSGTTLDATDIPSLDASKITSGTLDAARIPLIALERLVIVADAAGRYALTTADIQVGDTVKQSDTGEMWYVYDDAQLSSDAGYRVYTAGTASAAPWSGITNKPDYVTQAATASLDGYLTNDDWTHFNNEFYAGANTTPTYTDHGDGSITVNSLTAQLYDNATFLGKSHTYTLPALTTALTDGVMNYIVGDYNSGTPIMRVTTNVDEITESSIVPIISVFRDGLYPLEVQNWDSLGRGLANKLHQSIVKTQRYRRASGLSLSESGTRNVTCSSGIVWVGGVKYSLTQIDSASDPIIYFARTGGAWVASTVTQYNNTQYSDGTNTQTLSNNNKYAVNWLYRGVEDLKHLYMVLGTGDYTLEQAQASQPPADLPAKISSHGMLVGRVIVQKSLNTATQINSAFDLTFTQSAASIHNNLTGVQGGTTDEYYHMTATQHAALDKYAATLSWSGVGPYTMVIAAATHLHGVDPVVTVRELNGASYSNVIVDDVTVDALGNITLTSNTSFSGKVIVS